MLMGSRYPCEKMSKKIRIAINGSGVAGPALSWWLERYGFEPVMFEKAPALRKGGYVIDFWGMGYDIAEKMGLTSELREKGYLVNSLRLVDAQGQPTATLYTKDLMAATGDRFLSIPRSDLAETLFHACSDRVETRFGTHITGIEQSEDDVQVELSDGTHEDFDLVIGADGLHSVVRSLVFGDEEKFEHSLGAYVVAFTLPDYQPREDLVYFSHSVPGKQVSRFSLRDDRTLFLFIFRSELVDEKPNGEADEKELLRSLFKDSEWEVPAILSRLDETEDFYFDHVSQIRMDRWSSGRVGLVGDAAACASLLAGEGTGLAIAEAYVLAGELHKAKGDHVSGFQNYEQLMQPLLRRKQKDALRMVGFFAPANEFQLALSKWAVRAGGVPVLSKLLLSNLFKNEVELPDYDGR